MPDREKVIKALGCFCDEEEKPENCPCEFSIRNSHGCEWNVAKDTLAILKKQEAQKFFVDESGKITPLPIVFPNCPLEEHEAVKPRISSVEQRCGNCNKVIEMDGWIACPWCGKHISWEGR